MLQDTLYHSSLYMIVIYALNDSNLGFLLSWNTAFLVTIVQWKAIYLMQDTKL